MAYNKLYRGEYMIGVYAPIEEGETLLALCMNAGEFAELMRITKKNATQILHYVFTGKMSGVRFDRRVCSIAFIKDDQE